MPASVYHYIKVDERLIALIRKNNGEMRDALILAVLLHKAFLNDTVNLVIPHGEFEEYFGLSPYEVRKTVERLSRWLSVSRSNTSNRNIYTLHIANLKEDLEQVEASFLAGFFFPPQIPIIRQENSQSDLRLLREIVKI